MKSKRGYLKHLILSLSLVVTSSSFTITAFAESDPAIEQQKNDCLKNSANQWSSTLNRCIQKVKAQGDRHEADDCNKLKETAEREDCHKKLAEKLTGLSSDPNSLNQGKTSQSMILNTAYTIVALLNSKGSNGEMLSTTCTSKKIFGYTALAGMLSDLYLKRQAKKKVAELGSKYSLSVKTGASDSQSRALEYLKEEQNMVADIASQEKNRNMLLMLGYGAASIMGLVEMAEASAGTGNPDCGPKGDTKEAKNGDVKAAETTQPSAETPTPVTPTPASTTVQPVNYTRQHISPQGFGLPTLDGF